MDAYQHLWTTERDQHTLLYHLGGYAIIHHTSQGDETLAIDDDEVRQAVIDEMLAAGVVVLDDRTPHQLHAVVRGIVQGVGFRDFAQRRAQEIGLKGWVRNLQDNTVEVTAEGSGDQLLKFLSALREGPRAARVSGVDVTWHPAHSGFSDFRVTF
jgi:acylphosphatase